MPTYAYGCKDCSHTFDIVQSFSDSSLTACPECTGTLRKKFGSVGVSFKGSGFYRNDSRGGASSSAEKSTSGSSDSGSSDSSSSSSSSSDSSSSSTSSSSTSAPAAAPATSR